MDSAKTEPGQPPAYSYHTAYPVHGVYLEKQSGVTTSLVNSSNQQLQGYKSTNARVKSNVELQPFGAYGATTNQQFLPEQLSIEAQLTSADMHNYKEGQQFGMQWTPAYMQNYTELHTIEAHITSACIQNYPVHHQFGVDKTYTNQQYYPEQAVTHSIPLALNDRPPDYLVCSIFSCILGFPFAGFASILLSCRARKLADKGEFDSARRHSVLARVFAALAFGLYASSLIYGLLIGHATK